MTNTDAQSASKALEQKIEYFGECHFSIPMKSMDQSAFDSGSAVCTSISKNVPESKCSTCIIELR